MSSPVDVMMARARRMYILVIKVIKLCFYFLKEMESRFSVFLSSYRNTCKSLGELSKAVETLSCLLIPTAFLVLTNFHSCLSLTMRL